MMKTRIACAMMLFVVVGLVVAQARPHKAQRVDIPEPTIERLAYPLPEISVMPPESVVECGADLYAVVDFEPNAKQFQIVIACDGDPECSATLVYEGSDWQGEEYTWHLPCEMFTGACENLFGLGIGSSVPIHRVEIRHGTLVSFEVFDCE